jgi:hypothetical protein
MGGPFCMPKLIQTEPLKGGLDCRREDCNVLRIKVLSLVIGTALSLRDILV